MDEKTPRDLQVVWDEHKNELNKKKHHGVSFEEAKTVFFDENALLISDPEHSEDEERFLILGYSSQGRALVVSHCYREDDAVVRIISADKANQDEERQYLERL